jgi:protease-4
VKGNRSALWALIGVAIGFALPVIACFGITLVLSISLSSLGNQTAQTNVAPVHVSGPVTGPAVAIIDINGTIASGSAPLLSSAAIAASQDLITLIEAAALDADVRSIVLAINTPGGSTVASDEIYHALANVRIPIVVSMSEVAASGGYYISMASDYIYANPNTLTGSIGVITSFPDAHELLDKVGVEFNVITAGEVKDFGSPYRPMEPAEQEYWQELTNEVYQGFIEIVAQGREMDEAEVLRLADGRVYTGRRALALGLIDELGYQDDAIKKAAELGAIDGEPRVVRYGMYSPLSAILGERTSILTPGVPPDWLERLFSPTLEFLWMP